MPENANAQLVKSFFNRVLNAGELSSLEEFAHQDVLVPESSPGVEGLRRLLLESRATFSNPEYKVLDIVSEGEKVAVRFAAKVTHSGRYMGVPATGLRLNIWGLAMMRFEGSAISEFWSVFDSQSILKQLRQPGLPGAVPR